MSTIRNIGNRLPVDTVQHLRRPESFDFNTFIKFRIHQYSAATLEKNFRHLHSTSLLLSLNIQHLNPRTREDTAKYQQKDNTSLICKIPFTKKQFWVVIQNFQTTRRVNSDVMSRVSYTCSFAVSMLPYTKVLHRLCKHPCKQSQYKFHLRQAVVFYIITSFYVNSVVTTVY